MLMISVKRKILVGLALLLVTFSVTAFIFAKITTKSLPDIQGVVLASPAPLKPFKVISHKNQAFANNQLLGKWHIVSYGYTNCPDICPTTLKVLVEVKQYLEKRQQFDNVDVLFYSIDPQRDSSKHLAEYITYFDNEFIGLTSTNAGRADAIAFEKSLGLISVLTPLAKEDINEYSGSYSVSHGVMIYILNPDGELHAVLKPDKTPDGIQYFSANKIASDFIRVRQHFG